MLCRVNVEAGVEFCRYLCRVDVMWTWCRVDVDGVRGRDFTIYGKLTKQIIDAGAKKPHPGREQPCCIIKIER